MSHQSPWLSLALYGSEKYRVREVSKHKRSAFLCFDKFIHMATLLFLWPGHKLLPKVRVLDKNCRGTIKVQTDGILDLANVLALIGWSHHPTNQIRANNLANPDHQCLQIQQSGYKTTGMNGSMPQLVKEKYPCVFGETIVIDNNYALPLGPTIWCSGPCTQ